MALPALTQNIQFYDLDVLEMTGEFQNHMPQSAPESAHAETLGLKSDKLYLSKGGALGMTQEELEEMFSKHQLKPKLATEFAADGFGDEVQAAGIEDPAIGLSILVEMALHRRAKIDTLVGVTMHLFTDWDELEAIRHGVSPKSHEEVLSEAAQEAVATIVKLTNAGLVFYDSESEFFEADILPSNEVQEMLDVYQYPLPMIESPLEAKHNKQSGYRTIKRSLILKNNHHDDDICLDHINRMNRIPLALNMEVANFVNNKWKGIDKPRPDEDPEKFQQRKRAFQKYQKATYDVMEALVLHGNRFWLTHRYDKRGRTYCQGYHVTYQGNDWNKAVIEFSEKELLNPE